MLTSDRDISAWDARLKQQLERSFHNYHKRRIDLSVARDNKQFDWTGEILIVEKASSSDAIATVRLMFDDADPLTLEENVQIGSIFNRIFVTNDALVGEWLDVIAGINFEYKKKIADVWVDRGDTDITDLMRSGMTTNGAWHLWDLSGVVPNGHPRLVHISVLARDDTPDIELKFRTRGNVNTPNAAVFRLYIADIYHAADILVWANADSQIEYWASSTAWTEIYLRIRGWSA